MSNKRGQDLSITTLILIVIGVAVAAIIILGFWKGWDYIFGSVDLAPSELEKIAQVCKVDSQANLQTDYCQFKEIKTGQWVNCEDKRLKFDKETVITCDAGIGEKFCTDLKTGNAKVDLSKVYVNGALCGSSQVAVTNSS